MGPTPKTMYLPAVMHCCEADGSWRLFLTIKRKSSLAPTSSCKALTFLFKVRYFCLNDVKFILRFRVSCLATIGAFLLSAILLCFLGTVSIVSSETPLSELSGSMMNPAVVLIIPFFGLGTAIDTKVFFVWAGGDEGDDDGGDVVVKEGGGPVVEAGGDGDADGIVVGEDGGPVVVAGGGAYLRVINENFTVLQKSCSLFRRMKVRNIIKQLHWPASQEVVPLHKLLKGRRHCHCTDSLSWLINKLMSISLFT